MSPSGWIICLVIFAFAFWLVARPRKRDARRDQMAQENAELRHVVTEMSMEKHRRRSTDH